MPRPLLPPKGILVPTCMIYNGILPPPIFHTWVQLRGLAWSSSETPELSMAQLAALTGKNPSTLYGHMTFLRTWGALRWRPSAGGTFIVVFDGEGTPCTGSELPDSRTLEKPSLSSSSSTKLKFV